MAVLSAGNVVAVLPRRWTFSQFERYPVTLASPRIELADVGGSLRLQLVDDTGLIPVVTMPQLPLSNIQRAMDEARMRTFIDVGKVTIRARNLDDEKLQYQSATFDLRSLADSSKRRAFQFVLPDTFQPTAGLWEIHTEIFADPPWGNGPPQTTNGMGKPWLQPSYPGRILPSPT